MSLRSITAAMMASSLVGCASGQPRRNVTDATTRPAPANVVDQLAPFRSVRPMGDRVYLAAAEPREGPFATDLSLNGQRPTDSCEAKVGDSVSLSPRDLIGTGAAWYDIIAVSPEIVVLRENMWFYDVVPETHRILHVRPYGTPRK
jgi:hypothetical protein